MIRLIYHLCLLLVLGSSLSAAEAKVLPEVEAEQCDAFSWQNRKHFENQHQKFLALAEREYNSIIDQTIACIDQSEDFFRRSHAWLIKILKDTILDWLEEDVLTLEAYSSDGDSFYEENESSADEETSDEEGDIPEYYEKQSEFEQWKCTQLRRRLGVFVGSTDQLDEEAIDTDAIRRFLNNFVEDGYSWLINEKIETSLHVANDFSERVQKQVGVPRDLVFKILEGLWFDYDWEVVDIEDPLFVAKTYKKTLEDLKGGSSTVRIKDHLVACMVKLFTLNEADFKGALSCIRKNYNRYIEQKNWLGALIEWSVYSVYRKVFATPAKRSSIRRYETTSPALPLFSEFNRERYVTTRVDEARKRALDNYTKVYLHENIAQLVYKDTRGRRATLALADKLGELKKIGLSYEPYRPRKKENVFVPQLYFIVGRKSERPRFIEVPLKLGLPKRPLTKNADDGVFEGNDTAYYSQAKKDYIRGRTIQGPTETELKSKKDQDLVHSERVLMALLRKNSYVKKIVKRLGEQLGKGGYRVHSVVMLAYSTNSVCPQCTPTLVVLMNSHEEGGFLNLLTQDLLKQGYEVPRTNKKTIDWTKFRLNIFVTAKIDFCCEAHDMAEEGQHLYPTVKQVPKASNPHAKLHRPNNELLLSEVPQCPDGTPDKKQRFFYEFVGKDMHRAAAEEELDELYRCVVCSSGSTKWDL